MKTFNSHLNMKLKSKTFAKKFKSEKAHLELKDRDKVTKELEEFYKSNSAYYLKSNKEWNNADIP